MLLVRMMFNFGEGGKRQGKQAWRRGNAYGGGGMRYGKEA